MKRNGNQTAVLQYACVSHKGKVRSANQDNMVWARQYIPAGSDGLPAPVFGETRVSEPLLFGVFDGMGGEQRGEMASLIAAETAVGWPISADRDSLNDLCRAANRKICDYTAAEKLNTCGSTAAMIALDETGAVGCNLGDSRIYLIRDGAIRQMSEDHTLPNYRDRKSPLLQFLGLPETETTLEPAFFTRPAQDGDRYLICSDGLTDMLDGQAISSEMLSGQTLQDQAARLLDAALSAGGTDNVSFILLHLNVTRQEKNRRSFRAFLRSTREWLVRRIRACTKISGKS